VIRVDTIEDLFYTANLLANQPIPTGNRVGIVTNAGGPGILAADALEASGLTLPELSTELRAEIGSQLPEEASTRNPVDLIASGGPAEFDHAVRLLLESGEVDSVMVIYVPTTFEGAHGVASALSRCQERYTGGVALLSVFMHSGDTARYLAGGEGGRSIPTYMFPEAAAHALARAVAHGIWRGRDPGFEVRLEPDQEIAIRAIIDSAVEKVSATGAWMEPEQVDAILTAAGLRVPKSTVARSAEEAIAAAAAIGGPVVVKVISETALHKSDVGGVVLGVEGDDQVRTAHETVTNAVFDADGVLVQEFVAGGHEVLIGMTQDPNFGPLVGFGLGGVYVELLQDVAFRIHPLTDVDASEMVRETKGFRLLQGYRNTAEGDVAALEQALLRVSGLIGVVPELVEMDLNPVKVLSPGEGIVVVDARMRIQPVPDTLHPRMRDLPGVR
jgi:acyl-CoA synthetase (NDP forming)